MKRCNTCLVTKPLTDFHKHSARAKDRRYSYCKVCAHAASTVRRLRRRSKLDVYKQKKGCVECGYNGHPYALEWDHIDPSTKTKVVSAFYAGSLSRLFEEVRKCQVLCGNCHNIKTTTAQRTLAAKETNDE